jgi:hypothetical protein
VQTLIGTQCAVGNNNCTPSCSGKVCGDNGCGGSCGYCSSGYCSYGQCNGTNTNVACDSDSDCGTSGYIGSPSCSGNNVVQSYKTYACQNPGTTSSYCTNQTNQNTKQTCTSGYTCSGGACVLCVPNWSCGSWGTCTEGQQIRTCNDLNSCGISPSDSTTTQACCASNSDCGTDGYVGYSSCSGNRIVQNYKTYTCQNPGTDHSSCTNQTAPQVIETCLSGQVCYQVKCCTPKTCTQLGKICGSWNNNCGAQVNCGNCPNGGQCSSNGLYCYTP